MKKGLVVAVVFLFVLSLIAGCAKTNQGAQDQSKQQESTPAADSKTDGSSGDSSGDQKPVHLTMWVGTGFKNIEGYDSPNFGDWEKAKVKEFQQIHPNVSIDVQVVTWGDIEKKVNVAVAGGTQPDILYDAVPQRVMKHARAGVMEPIDEVVADDREDWKQVFLDEGTYDGKLYALPLASNPTMLVANKTLFDQKQVALPEDRDWTWEEFKDALKRVSGNGVYGTAFYAKNEQSDYSTISFISGSGAEFLNQDRNGFVLNSSEGVEGLTYMVDLIKDGLVVPGAANLQWSDTFELFKQGKVATIIYTPQVYDRVAAGIKDGSVAPDVQAYGMLLPHKEGVVAKTTITSENGYGVFKQTDPEKRKMALAFVKFLVQPENIKLINKANYSVPARKSSSFKVDNDDYNTIIEKLNQLEIQDVGKDLDNYATIRQKFYPEMQAAFLQAKTPKQALDDLVKEINPLIPN